MIRSMTGFASSSRENEAGRVHVTMKSVNHRFLDVALKAPSVLASIEARIRLLLQQRLTRGRIEIMLSADIRTTPERDVTVDERLVERLAAALEPLRARGLVSGPLAISDLLRVPQAFEVKARSNDPTESLSPLLVDAIEAAVIEAADALVDMRSTEGRFIAEDLDSRLGVISRFVDELKEEAAAGQSELGARLRERLASLPPDMLGDPSALAQEILRFVSRSDVDEEIVRLRAHLEHWRTLADGPEACGRKLDFLVQEMNREINTIGSKVEGPRATAVVIDAKAELERIREQAQNVE
jgi:uncharacterized protein (TIGR00255 family)